MYNCCLFAVAEKSKASANNSCELCPATDPAFGCGFDRDRHLLEEHGYDTCNICKLIGKL
jgi:hypothetical protein